MLLPKRKKLHHSYRGRRNLVPILLLLATFGFCALQLFLHPAHDASVWSFPTVVVVPLPRTLNAANHNDNYNYTLPVADEDTISSSSSSSSSWGWWWWWIPQRREHRKGMLEPASRKKERSPRGASKRTNDAGRPRYHLVFSTSCGRQQDWESFVFFYHAYKVRQPGNVVSMHPLSMMVSFFCGGQSSIQCVPNAVLPAALTFTLSPADGVQTRIASGCTVKEAKELFAFHQRFVSPMNPNFHVHFTPSYGRIHEVLPHPDPDHPHKGPYKYMNKPYV
jgi:hypothetical protein